MNGQFKCQGRRRMQHASGGVFLHSPAGVSVLCSREKVLPPAAA
ncbi:MAG TPA: hypothetical protein VK388_13705 [Pyrinomonadaceae bacterium]|nr:hypothetical protein [Pyrinomonadaceae bacterium]